MCDDEVSSIIVRPKKKSPAPSGLVIAHVPPVPVDVMP